MATENASNSEIVRQGDTGLVVPPGDTPALTQAPRRLVTDRDLRLILGSRDTAHVVRQFDAETNARRLLDLLKVEADIARSQGQKTAPA